MEKILFIKRENLDQVMSRVLIVALVLMFFPAAALAEEVQIDASDPTKIYTYAGGGLKYTDYTNGESMWELRGTGNLGLSAMDMLLFELGYGWHNGDLVPGSNSGLTNSRFRWFHLFTMDYSVTKGYRGWATQVDLQLAGELKGTDGQNTLALGAIPAYGLGDLWSLFLPVNLVNTWDKEFEYYNGLGLGLAPLLVYSPEKWWPGAYLQIWPNYTWFVAGEFEGTSSGNIDIVTGGQITSTTLWSVTLQKYFDEYLRSLRRGPDTGLKADWSVFGNVTWYF